MIDGEDVLGIAQTGTGKTASFVLPLLQYLANDGPGRARPAPRTAGALILAPTRELAGQIAESVRTYGRHLKPLPRLALVVGGVKAGPQIKALQAGVDIIIATPGRLEDHLAAGHVRLNQTDAVVLDEADQMLDMGFIPAIRRILGKLPQDRQSMLLSATMPPAIKDLARGFLDDPVEISVAPAATPVERITQIVEHHEPTAKRSRLVELLSDPEMQRGIVFTRTKRGADRVCKNLVDAGLKAAAIHGDKSQGQRDRALGDFKAGRLSVLVATDIAARGIDIGGVTHVVNYELPNVPDAYVHRIGRTARAGASGKAISLVAAIERPLLKDIERLIGKPLPVEGPVPRAVEEDRSGGGGKGPRRRRPAGGGNGGGQGSRPRTNGQRPANDDAPAPVRPQRRRRSGSAGGR